ncbi:hypothetical protein Nepgr_001579 [Nepenthes gracilis]|uniref:Phospholipid/glycerol acyltransferase domain-containing protein n=1 Tax=Nepenthes gracilis TaxID=150966 RepID=A0AAD3P699_NEPGR|nr:hypothetical protein Nepgr_001579 [Nepenthes gracilis]
MVGHWFDRGDLWKSKARTLQFQFRERFRVAVDNHLQQPMFSGDGYFSSTMRRWLQRFHSFRGDSLAPSSAFYSRRVVSKDIYAEEDSAITRMLQSLAVPILGNVCHVFMHGFNSVQVYGAEKLHQVLLHRPKDKPLITVSNHVASMDDPLVIASLLPPRVLMEAHNLRWTLCATDRCFKNPVASAFFKCVKVLPVSRGDGLYQKGLDMAISKLNSGGWVHIFPEGSRSRDGGRTVGFAKRGVGRLVLDADNTPIVVPFVHTGMQEIVPIGATFPRIGKTVTVLIGDPISFDDLLKSRVTELASRENLCDAISSRIGNRLQELKAQVDQLALEQSTRMRNLTPSIADKAMVFLQQVDWELFGISSWIVSPDDSTAKQEKSQEQQIHIHRKLPTSDRRYQMKAMIEEGIRSRIRGCLESTEMTVFAGRSFLLNQRKNKYVDVRDVSPLQAWKPYGDANWQRQWNYAVVWGFQKVMLLLWIKDLQRKQTRSGVFEIYKPLR